MDVFKELIDELKDENLLEQTDTDCDDEYVGNGPSIVSAGFSAVADSHFSEAALAASPAEATATAVSASSYSLIEQLDLPMLEVTDHELATPAAKPTNTREFYKKRAVGEMSHLQMVEHVLTGVEREYMKVVPKTFDDFAAKKALNAFLKVSEDESSQHSQAELAMMEETEAWCTALAARDRAIPVAKVRQYCENSKPALSSQALVALARFYRNVPFSESVRSKFDFVITRLFSRPVPGNKRVCLFSREEMLNHISLLYKEWSSVPLYAANDDQSNILLTALSFEELANEAENASTFDFLIANDFFGRLGMFKESVSEVFFAPNVTAAAIDCNVRVGNAYVTLIENERVKMDTQSMYSKFAAVDNLMVSDAAARTLEIVDILRKQRDSSVKVTEQPAKIDRPVSQNDRSDSSTDRYEEGNTITNWKDRLLPDLDSGGFFHNRWVLGAMLLLVVSVGIFAWTAFRAPQEVSGTTARTIELPNSVLKKHLKTARISGANFYGLLLPSWNDLSKEKQEEYVKVIFDFAKEKGCSQVDLLDSEGKPAALASPSKIELVGNK